MLAPFGVHHLDRIRAAEYLLQALKDNIDWNTAEIELMAYMSGQGFTPAAAATEIDRAKALLKPWLT